MEQHEVGPIVCCSMEILRGEGFAFNVWGRKIRDAEERREVLIDDFYFVCEDIVLSPFSTHLGGTRLRRTRLGEARVTGHPEIMDKSSTT